jgi:hypothetical protein
MRRLMARCAHIMQAKTLSRCTILTALFFCLGSVVRAQTGTNAFGFSGPEIYPIDDGIALLHSADLDGDGLNDLIVANNLRAKINLLYNQTGKTNRTADAKLAQKTEINDLPPDARFRIDSIPADERISAMDVVDLNGDGRPDIVYYGDAKDLIVLYNLGTNGWSEPKRWHIEDGRLDGNALVTGDLNGDGLTDIVLLGDNGSLYFLAQQADHTLAEPQKISYSGTPKSVQIVDVTATAKVICCSWIGTAPRRSVSVCKTPAASLARKFISRPSPCARFGRTMLETNGKTYVVTIAQTSGRAEVSQFTRRPATFCPAPFARDNFKSCP